MSDVVICVFEDEFKAQEVRIDLLKNKKKHLIDLEDAICVRRNDEGKVRLHHMTHLTLGGTIGGGFLGSLFGIMLLNPVFALFGMATGAIVGAVSGSMSHAGIGEDFMGELAEHLKPGTSALCILVREHVDNVLREISKYGGKVLHASLLHEDETALRAVIDSINLQPTGGKA
jgi:uncharacterized membrane protein